MRVVIVQVAVLTAILVLQQGFAQAQTGVSDDRVSLPEGPGSLEGVGENVDANPNMGTMQYSVPINVPAGFAGLTPDLRLSYNSGGGSGVVGVGWSMMTPYIERMTYRGLPDYGLDDDFSADGGQQLVFLPGSSPRTYRARYEKGFVRYRWHEAGEGNQGYWTAEFPDGRIGYFGATAEGDLVDSARVGADEGTFRYMLVEMVDVYGHVSRYTYQKSGEVALLRNIGYVFTSNPNEPRYSVSFQYQERMDQTGFDYLSDAKGGFDELLTQRLAAVNVFSGPERIRRYELAYESYDESGGFTRLKSVQMLGLGDEPYPARNAFTYSQALGGVCGEDQACAEPFVVDMGNIGVNVGVGRATLLDINGDSLPDIVNTSADGPHTFLLNIPTVDGTSQFEETPRVSALPRATGSDFRLGSAFVHTLDVNGDGFTDLIHAQTGRMLINRGLGDWAEFQDVVSEGISDSLGTDFDVAEGELRSIRFLDYDNDKRIDLMRATRTETRIIRNTPEGFVDDPDIDHLGYGINTDKIDFSDMNGDGLLDAVKLNVGALRYKLNLGRGRWGEEVEVLGLPLEESELDRASLEDLNGDGLSDLVVVAGTQIKYAISRNGTTFTDITVLGPDDVDGALFDGSIPVTVLFADMNGSGSADIVWLTVEGDVKYLELFPVRPNLLSKIENGLGKVTEITYATSVSQMALDGGWEAWEHRLPYPMQVVAQLDDYDLLTNIHNITNYRYRDGFYDGIEKQFRGYAVAEIITPGDETQEDGLTTMRYDVGATDPYRNGLQLESNATSAGRELMTSRTTYEDCPVAEVPEGTDLPVRHICPVASVQTRKEGADPSEWATIESTMEYDGYGNVVRSSNFGVTAIGGQGCAPCERGEDEFGAPCGSQCLGDEVYSETEYITPGEQTSGRWILGAAFRASTFGRPGSALKTETLTYYDGDAFVGLPLGSLDQGKVTRATVKVDDNKVIETGRVRYDAHGNVIESIAPNGALDGQTHRRRYVMDEDQLRVVQLNMVAGELDGEPYELQRNIIYEPTFDRVVSNSVVMRVVGGEVVSSPRSTSYTYDAFGRQISTIMPGDSAQAPSQTFTYDIGSPVSRVIISQGSESGGPLDLETIRCIDGKGRLYQNRQRLENGQYQIDGFNEFNTRGAILRQYQPYVSDSAQCDTAPPEGTLFSAFTFDATFRALSQILPDESLYGTASMGRTVYLPLGKMDFDVEDNDPDSPHHNTPSTLRFDGLGRTVGIEQTLNPGEPPAITQAHFDGLGRMTGYSDADGNRKTQEYDLLGRAIVLNDPNTKGSTLLRYDDNGNVVSSTDPRGVETLFRFDSLDRLVERWDAADRQGTSVKWVFDAAPDCPTDLCTNTEGQLAEVNYPGLDGEVAHDRFGYDARGRGVANARTLAGTEFRFGKTYDNTNRVVSMSYPNGDTVSMVYDHAARLKTIDGIIDNISYDERGSATSMTRGDGSTQVMSYDALIRMEQDTTMSAQGTVLQGWSYTYDRKGNRLTFDDLSDATERLNTAMEVTYDAWYRPVRVDYPESGESQTTDFDLINNITSRTLDAEIPDQRTFQYDPTAPNALLQAGGVTFAYDEAGHVITRGDQQMTWDYMGRMVRVDDASGATVLRAGFGPSTARIYKQEGDSTTLYLSNDFEIRDGISVRYVRAGLTRVARFEDDGFATTLLSDLALAGEESDGQINAADAWFALGAEQGALEIEGEPSDLGSLLMSSVRRMHADRAPEVTHLHHNHLGSITLATAEGEMVGQRSFTDLGEVRASTGFVDLYGFTGQERDPSTGLLCFLWRLYDPNVGRWMSIDPLFATSSPSNFAPVGDSTTGYAYVRNNFTNLNDPFGLDPEGSAKAPKGNGDKNAKKTKQDSQAQKSKPSKNQADIYAVKKNMKNFGMDITSEHANAVVENETGKGDKTKAHKDVFTKKTTATQGILNKSMKFIRVYNKTEGYTPKVESRYVSPDSKLAADIESGNTTPQQIQKDLALPRAPTHYRTVTVPKGTKAIVGEVAPQNYGNGSGDLPGGSSQVIAIDFTAGAGHSESAFTGAGSLKYGEEKELKTNKTE